MPGKPLTANSPHRAGWLEKVTAVYADVLAAGFPVTLDGVAEHLQCRNELDRTNWMELRDSCRLASAGGFGDAPIAAPGLRCVSNRFHRPTVAQTIVILADLKNWVQAAQVNCWRLKDLVTTAATLDDLKAIDLGAGWP